MMFCVLLSSFYSKANGYYIYKFGINSNDKISLNSSKYIDGKLKVSKIESQIQNPFLYKLIDTKNNVLFEGKLTNPKIVYFEDFINEKPLKSTFVLDSAYFVIKIPAFDDIKKIEFYETNKNSKIIEKISEIKLNDE